MKSAVRFAIFAAVLSFASPAFAQNVVDKEGAVPDLATAQKFAEKAVVDMVAEPNKLEAMRPWQGAVHSGNWVIISRPVGDPKNPTGPKRAFIVTVSGVDGSIIDISTID